ncbi:YrhK family protein [Bacillus sp. JCM 19041]|uniref:YrhK family protein n=1 Tax=Bacillus sp. JCM 19041 TaxID=1460637 RepID=UPI000A9AB241
MSRIRNKKEYLDVKAGGFRLFFKKRYKLITTVNDILIGFFFVGGSILNFFSTTETYGRILYLGGSLLLASRPVLRIAHDTSLRRK